MKLKTIKKLILIIFILIISFFIDAFFGNPISKYLAQRAAKEYIEKYEDEGFKLDTLNYSFKFGEYNAIYKVPNSRDKYFSAQITKLGKVRCDSYQDIISGFNTSIALDEEYRNICDKIFDKFDKKYKRDIDYVSLDIYESSLTEPFKNKDGLKLEDLIVDKKYNINNIAKTNGNITLSIAYGNGSLDEAAECLIYTRDLFNQASINFYGINFTFYKEYKSEEERIQNRKNSLSLIGFRKDFIVDDREKLKLNILKAKKEVEEYYKLMDSKRKPY